MKACDLLTRASGQIGVEPTGQDRVDLDVVRRPCAGERTRQLNDATLARGIGSHHRPAEYRIHRSDVENLAAAHGLHVRVDRLSAEQCTAEIHIEHFAPVIFREQLWPLAYRGTGIVDENIATAEIARDLPDHALA